MSHPPATGYTASWLLSGGRAQVTESLRGIALNVARNSALAKLSEAALKQIGDSLADATYGLLDIDLGALLVAGVRRHSALIAAARATSADPGATEVVQLATHRVSVSHGTSSELATHQSEPVSAVT